MNQKGLMPILIVILVAAAVLGGYFIYQNQPKPTLPPQSTPQSSPTPDPTSNWKTYTDNVNGFSFKYPEDWYSDKIDNSKNDPYLRPVGIGELSNYGYPTTYFFRSGDKADPKGKKQLFLQVISNENFEQIENSLDLNPPSTFINGKKTLRYATGVYTLLDPTNNKIIHIVRSQYPDDKGYLDKIISTLKFLDQPNEGEFCGGIAGLPCLSGYKCILDGNHPDAGGKCVKE